MKKNWKKKNNKKVNFKKNKKCQKLNSNFMLYPTEMESILGKNLVYWVFQF